MGSNWDLTEYRVIDAACLLAHMDPDELARKNYVMPPSVYAQFAKIIKQIGATWIGEQRYSDRNLLTRRKITRAELESLASPNPIWTPSGELHHTALAPTVDKPIKTTERNTLLTIIAALCDYSAIKFNERGTAGKIAKLTEEIGARVSHDTVKKVLSQIPDALETRMK